MSLKPPGPNLWYGHGAANPHHVNTLPTVSLSLTVGGTNGLRAAPQPRPTDHLLGLLLRADVEVVQDAALDLLDLHVAEAGRLEVGDGRLLAPHVAEALAAQR